VSLIRSGPGPRPRPPNPRLTAHRKDQGVSRNPCSSRAAVGRRLARRRTRAVAESLPRTTTQPDADPSVAQQSVGLRDTP
jgi:hypothetical protein